MTVVQQLEEFERLLFNSSPVLQTIPKQLHEGREGASHDSANSLKVYIGAVYAVQILQNEKERE